MANFNEIALNDMMRAIRKNTMPSRSIDVFEELLREIDSEEVDVIVTSMNQFIEEFMLIKDSAKNAREKRFKSRMINVNFIKPERFFKEVCLMTDKAIAVNSCIFLYNTNLLNDVEHATFCTSVKSLAGELNVDPDLMDEYSMREELATGEISQEIKQEITNLFNEIGCNYEDNTALLNLHEKCRKLVLVWNYIPAIIKAIIQTERRKLGFDTNSKRFPVCQS
jgi:ASC-1-like (ASCH) protein